MRLIALAALSLLVVACGAPQSDPAPAAPQAAADASSADAGSVAELQSSIGALKGAAAAVATDAAQVAGEALDTRTACALAGQEPAGCGCLEEALGPRLTGEHVGAITAMLTEAAGGSLATAVEGATSIDPQLRQKLTQCAVRTAIQGAVAN